MEGQNRVRLLKKPQDGDYEIGVSSFLHVVFRSTWMGYYELEIILYIDAEHVR